MSRFEYLQQCAKWAKGRMWKQKAKVETFTATDGTTINGWKVSYIGGWNEENHYSKTIGDYEEWWGRDEAVLSTKGILYVYSQTTHEIGSGRTETKQASTKKETRLRPLDTTNFGRKGVIVTMQDMIKILQAMGR